MTVSEHWDAAYSHGDATVSWRQDQPEPSRSVITAMDLDPTAPIVDIGGGSSALTEALLAAGHLDLTVVDLSSVALDLARDRLGKAAEAVTWVCADLLAWEPGRTYAVWHDRAVLHFITDDDDRARYVEKLAAGVEPGGRAVLATFAEDGPQRCSGLPVRRTNVEELGALLTPAFTVIRAWRDEHRTPSGALQPFSWVVARRVASD